ncbi:hypothetical protein D3C71_1703970 [compost metagenome]
MAGRLRHRTGLTPTRHASVDQARIACRAHAGTQTQALHHAGAHSFDQRVGILDELQDQLAALGGLEIGDHRALAPVEQCRRRVRCRIALDRDDVGTEVG